MYLVPKAPRVPGDLGGLNDDNGPQ